MLSFIAMMLNPAEPGVISNCFRLKTQPDYCGFGVVDNDMTKTAEFVKREQANRKMAPFLPRHLAYHADSIILLNPCGTYLVPVVFSGLSLRARRLAVNG